MPAAIVTPLSSASFTFGAAQPGDADKAAALIKGYEDALVAHDWRTAWDMLAKEQQIHWVSFENFVYWRSLFFTSRIDTYTPTEPTHDELAIKRWVLPDNYPAAPITPATADYDRAFIVEVDYPAMAGDNRGYEFFLIAPDAAGNWRIWQVR